MEKQQSIKGIGKENQLSRIAAAVNPGSATAANPDSTKSMIQTFVKHFDSVALTLVNEIDDDQRDLVKNMVAEITKLQTKNIQEFEKAIAKIVGMADKMLESNNPRLQQIGQGMQDQAKQELFKAKGITLSGEHDTFKNRLKREISGGNFDPTKPKEKTSGLGKIKNFWTDTKSEFKKGARAAMQEGSFADRVFTTDEEKRNRELQKLETSVGEDKTESLADMFKKTIEELLDKSKEDKSDKKDKGGTETASEQQEDSAGISKDAMIEAAQKTSETSGIIEKNTKDTADTLEKILGEVKQISEKINTLGSIGGSGGGGSGFGIEDLLDMGGGSGGGGAKPSRGLRLRARGRLLRMRAGRALRGVRSFGSRALGGARSLGSRALQLGGRGLNAVRGFGGRALQLGSRAVSGAAELVGGISGSVVAGAAGAVAATGAILYGTDKFIKSTNVEARKKQEEGTAKFGLTGNNLDGFFINGKPAGKYKDLPEYYKNVADGYGANNRGGAAERARQYVETHNPDGSKKVEKKTAAVEKDKKKTDAKVTPKTPAKQVTTPPPVEADEIVVTAPKKKAEVDKTKQTKNPPSVEAEEIVVTAPKKKAEIEKVKQEKSAVNSSGKTGQVAAKQNNSGENLKETSKKATAKTETGRNVDGALIEAGTSATKEKMKINVPPPTVINQGGGQGNSGPNITAPGGVRNVRTDEPSWLRFQQKRAGG
ncbi:MAG: hypothetical protein EBU66_04380 [Bacteroidetes bacterium]|nr:hypothetical protein [bacterium]NBP63905.1 hypothetical protein [Bacteroidota bacterium]